MKSVMRSLILLVVLFLMFDNTNAQYTQIPNTYRPPLDIPLKLSGNFAELRSGHFHSGIDIKTQGVTGKKVFAIEDGYVSRIKIQTNGYGHSLYINYPDGRTSLFGHLTGYNQAIADYVKKYQYRNQVFEVDIYPSPGDLPVKKGEVVAWSGNTGSSGGPHLHFELRNTADQHPLNVLRFGFPIDDHIPPRLYSLFVYGMEGEGRDRITAQRKEYDLAGDNGSYSLRNDRIIPVDGPVGIGLECYDYLDGTLNRCGVYSIELFENNELIYHFQTDEFSFGETRYLNAHTDYSLTELTRRRTHDLFRKPGEFLSMNKLARHEGIIRSRPGETINLMIVVRDAYGNESELRFRLKGAENPDNITAVRREQGVLFRWYTTNDYADSLIRISLPKGALYQNTNFRYHPAASGENKRPADFHIHSAEVPLHRYAALSLKTDEIPESLLPKTGIVLIPEKGNPEWQGGTCKGGWIRASVREYGDFTLRVDTVPPVITPLNIAQDRKMTRQKSIRFRINDQLSGISNYEGYIDNHWVLFEYDPKSELLFYSFDPERLEEGGSHELELYVKDEAGNSSLYHTTFQW